MKIKLLLLTSFIAFSSMVQAQGSKNIIQFSGIVVGGDSLYGIPGVYIYIPKAGRGTSTNDVGYFSIPSVEGDSVHISALGFKNQIIKVPKSEKQSVTLFIELQEDTTYYPIVEIFPYPTEEIFKQAFLALRLNDDGTAQKVANNLNPTLLQRMIRNSSMSSSENQKYSLRNQMYQGTGNYLQGFQILNPFAWSSLVKTIRKNKQKPEQEEDNQ